jgi:1,2-diacylglycerol-3-alpha-glucose alpha-1,2-glucosyltransferase
MKVLLPKSKAIANSGIGHAIDQQEKNLKANGIEIAKNLEEADIVHINYYFDEVYHIFKKAKKMGKPIVVHGHSTIQDTSMSFRLWKLYLPIMTHTFLRFYRKADLIITPTEYSKKLIQSYKGVTQNVVAISNGINIANYDKKNANIEGFKKLIGAKDGDTVILSIGFPMERKGIIDFIKVARKFPEYKFVWCGDLNWFLRTHNVNHAIAHKPSNVILPGYVGSDLVKGGLYFSKLFFFPSKEETEGIVVLEALATKTPILIRDIGVYQDWLTDGVDCYKGVTNEDFENKIKYILSRDNKKVIENGYKVVEKRNSQDTTKQIIDIYKSLIEKNKK